MPVDRNESAHVYDEERIIAIFERVSTRWVGTVERNLTRLKAHET